MTVKEVFTVAMMLSFCHSFLIEAGVALSVGVRLWIVVVVRVGLAISSALIIHHTWSGGSETAKYGLVPTVMEQPDTIVEMLLLGIEKASIGIFQMALIIIPLMLIVQFLRDYQYMQKLSNVLAPFTKVIGVKPNASMTLVAGLIVGLAYGAGLMIQAVEEDGVDRKDATLVFIFLLACHAIVEDTLLFYPLGIPIWPLFIIRVCTAFILTIFVAFILQKAEKTIEKEVFVK